MGAIDRLAKLFDVRTKTSAFVQMVNPGTGILATVDEFAVAPNVTGREAVLILHRMFDTDSHLEGLANRIIIALLSAKIQIKCEDEDVEKFVKEQLGIVEGVPPSEWTRFLNELASSLKYGFSLHHMTEENTDEGTVIVVRRIEPTDVHEFTVNGDKLVSVAESYSKEIHGVNPIYPKRRIQRGTTVEDDKLSEEYLANSEGDEVVDIPADELLHIAPLQLGRNYFGRSIFKAAIGGWAYKIVYLFCDAIRQGRFSVPWLIGKLSNFEERNPKDAQALAKVFQMPAAAIDRMLMIRKDDEVQALEPGGNTDIMKSVAYYDFSHSKMVLEQFVDTGDKSWGSRSTYTAGSDDFNDSLNFYEMSILAGVHKRATRIADANFTDHAPIQCYFKEMGLARQRMIELWKELVADRVVRRGAEDEQFLRDRMGFPRYVEGAEVEPFADLKDEEPEDGDGDQNEPPDLSIADTQ